MTLRNPQERQLYRGGGGMDWKEGTERERKEEAEPTVLDKNK